MTEKKGTEVSADNVCESVGIDATGTSTCPMEAISNTSALDYALSEEGLYESLQKCIKGTNWKTSVASFELNGLKKCHKLSKQLNDRSYVPKKLKTFDITRPKRRTCTAIGITDRVYQRSLNDNIVYPKMTLSLIRENAACQKGKGTDYARNLLKRDLFRVNYNQPKEKHGYALLLDIHGYYPNMWHKPVKDAFKRYLDKDEYKRVEEILDYQYPGEVGFTPGSQLIQIAGISVLNTLDHYIKETLRIKYYIRYMDDFVLLHESKEYLQNCKLKIEAFLNTMKFELNKSKSQLIDIYSQPIPFLGFTFQIKSSGKIIVRVKASKFREQKRRLKRLRICVTKGTISLDSFDNIANEDIRYLKKNCNVSRYYKEYNNLYQSLRKELNNEIQISY